LLLVVALARSGSVLFWHPGPTEPQSTVSATHDGGSPLPTVGAHRWAIGLLLVAVLGCAAAAGPVSNYCTATAAQLFERKAYLRAVLQAEPAPAAFDLRREMRERETRTKGNLGATTLRSP
jgi:multicomponent K+:H+ antiporter subunit D